MPKSESDKANFSKLKIKPFSSSVRFFLKERCEFGGNQTVKSSKLYQEYVDWCAETQSDPVPRDKFFQFILCHFSKVIGKYTSAKQERSLVGLGLKEGSIRSEETTKIVNCEFVTHLKPGDVITHTRCMGCLEEHVFTEMEGPWICGFPTADTMLIEGERDETDDIHPNNVTHINRIPIAALDFVSKQQRRPYAEPVPKEVTDDS